MMYVASDMWAGRDEWRIEEIDVEMAKKRRAFEERLQRRDRDTYDRYQQRELL